MTRETKAKWITLVIVTLMVGFITCAILFPKVIEGILMGSATVGIFVVLVIYIYYGVLLFLK